MKKKFDGLKQKYGDNEELRQMFCVDITNLLISYKNGTSNIQNIQKKKEQDYKINEMIKLQEHTNVKLDELCDICLDKFNLLDPNNAFLDCGCVIHLACFKEYIETVIANRTIKILCPNSSCKKLLNPKMIVKALESSPELLKKYEKWDLEDYASMNNKDISCCPTPDCDYMFFYVNNNNDNDTKFSCPICYEEYCFKCKTNYHHDETCTEYRKRVEGDSKYDAEFFNLVL